MKKNNLIFGILFLVIFTTIVNSTCLNINVSDFHNQTINLSTYDCITILDNTTNNTLTINSVQRQYSTIIYVNPEETKTDPATNITCVGNSVKQNNQINMPPGSSFVDSVSNNTYNCQQTHFNHIDINITNSTIYTSEERNITVFYTPTTCPTCPTIPTDYCYQNITQTLDYNQTFHDNRTNITITAPNYPKLNVVYKIPDFSHSYSNQRLNLTVQPPDFPKINKKYTLDCGKNLTDTTYNLSVFTKKPTIKDSGKTINTNAGETYVNDDINLKVVCKPPISKEVLNPGFGETLIGKYGTKCIGIPKQNKIIYLGGKSAKFDYEWKEANLTVRMNDSNISYCYKTPLNMTALHLLNQNQSKCTKGEVCLNMFEDVCTLDEIYKKGDIYGCFHRIVNQDQQRVKECQKQLQEKSDEVNRWKQPFQAIQSMRADDFNMTLLYVAIILSMASIVVYVVFHRKKLNSIDRTDAITKTTWKRKMTSPINRKPVPPTMSKPDYNNKR